MPTEIKMPQLSDTMESGKILSWYKKEGDSVKRGDSLAEVETEKANLEIECFQEGVLLKIIIPAGTVARVGEVIALVGQSGEILADLPSEEAPERKDTSDAIEAPLPSVSSSTEILDESDRIKASPLAKKVAEEMHIDLASVSGSGPGGRIVRKDVETLSSQATAQATRPETLTPHFQHVSVTTGASESTDFVSQGHSVPLTKMRETIAHRMQESFSQVPHFFVTVSVNMDEVNKLREILKEDQSYKDISVNHFIIKACAHALKKVPRVNSSLRDGQVFEPANINIGIITSVEDGLLIPVIRNADSLPMRDIVLKAKAAVERAKTGKPTSTDLTGGTFSISNMGMLDVENFTAIINPGQGAILAVSSIKKEPVVEGNAVRIAHMMKVTLSSDHRVIDGVTAAEFLKSFKEALQIPALMFI